ncbi:MAG: cysteine peptidase family C39 domain-containing protein [Candidatus Nanoarchaeia archaeon]|nr:cysteine peptidase family C39 domain-containing protein [Candidatus Nanoarchaeia archaeon]
MKMLEFPELKQSSNYDCGAIVIQGILNYYGIDIREDFILKEAKTTINGTPIKSIIQILQKHKIKCIAKEMTINDLINYIDKNIPVIVHLQAYWKKKNVNWKITYESGHYAIVIGYDSQRIYFEDPFTLERTFLKNNDLLERWHGMSDDNKKVKMFAIAAIGKKINNYKKIIKMK